MHSIFTTSHKCEWLSLVSNLFEKLLCVNGTSIGLVQIMRDCHKFKTCQGQLNLNFLIDWPK